MSEPVDVCIVGAGPCGAVAAVELAAQGLSVVVLEAGPRWQPARDFANDELQAARLYWPEPRTCTGEHPLETKQGWGLGGTSQLWQGMCPRYLPSDFRVRSTDGLADDWPLPYETVAALYPRVEAALGVVGAPGSTLPPHQPSWLAQVLAQGTARAGVAARPGPVAILAAAHGDRPGCIQCGWCTAGCPTEAKATAANTYIPRAEALGVEFRSGAWAVELPLDAVGERVRAVRYLDAAGREHEQPCRAVVLAAGVIETPRLLLLSTSGRFPQGLANSSGLVGRYLTVHVMRTVLGQFPFPIHAQRGFELGALYVDAWQDTQPGAGHARGYVLEALHLRPLAYALATGAAPAVVDERLLDDYYHHGAWWICGEALPQQANTVTLDLAVRDRHGLPVARLTYAWHANDLALADAATRRAAALLAAAGATRTQAGPIGMAHLAGTCRMGNDPTRSVLNAHGQAHDVPNLFVADASSFVTAGAANITLTAMAVATHVAGALAARARRGDI